MSINLRHPSIMINFTALWLKCLFKQLSALASSTWDKYYSSCQNVSLCVSFHFRKKSLRFNICIVKWLEVLFIPQISQKPLISELAPFSSSCSDLWWICNRIRDQKKHISELYDGPAKYCDETSIQKKKTTKWKVILFWICNKRSCIDQRTKELQISELYDVQYYCTVKYCEKYCYC